MQKRLVLILLISSVAMITSTGMAFGTGVLTIKGDGINHIFDIQNSGGTNVIWIDKNGIMWFPTGNYPVFSNSGIYLRNQANTYTTNVVSGAVTANYTLTLPLVTGNDTLAALGVGQTFTGTNVFNSLTLGGQMNLNGQTMQSGGHVYSWPSNTGTVQLNNDTFNGALGALTSNSFTQNGHTYTLSSNTGTFLLANGSASSLSNVVNSISGTTGNITASSSTGSVTLNFGSNVVTTGGSSQTVTKPLTLNNGVLGGNLNVGTYALINSGHQISLPSNTGTITLQNGTFSGTLSSANLGNSLNANSNRITSLGAPSASTDADRANTEGLLGMRVVGTCANGQVLQYQSSNSTWICATAGEQWTLLGRNTLSSSATSISLTITPTKYMKFEIKLLNDGSYTQQLAPQINFNSDTGNNYAQAYLYNGAFTGTAARSNVFLYGTSTETCNYYFYGEIMNEANYKKIGDLQDIPNCGTALAIANWNYEWVDTSNQISTIKVSSASTGSFQTGSEIIVYGHN